MATRRDAPSGKALSKQAVGTSATGGNVRAVPGGSRFPEAEADWLRRHGAGYMGQWVAVGPEGLLAVAQTLPDLMSLIREAKPAEAPVVCFIE